LLDAGVEYMLNPENPPGGRKQMWGSLQSLYSNLAGEDSKFPYKEPYQMTDVERAQGMMQDPTTFRMLGKEMLKRDEKPDEFTLKMNELKIQKAEKDIQLFDYKFRESEARIAAYNRSKTTDQNDKKIVAILKLKLQGKRKDLEMYMLRSGTLNPNKIDEWQPILDDISAIYQQLDDYMASEDGGVRDIIPNF